MDKWIFIFETGATILIHAKEKLEAIQLVEKEYKGLFNSNFEVRRVDSELVEV